MKRYAMGTSLTHERGLVGAAVGRAGLPQGVKGSLGGWGAAPGVGSKHKSENQTCRRTRTVFF